MQAQAKSIITEVLSVVDDAGSASIQVGVLIDACAIFGFGPNTVRVTLAKMRAAGSIVSPGRGFYALGARSRALSLRVMSWRSVEQRMIAWDGSWAGVYVGHLPRSDRTRLRSWTRALRLLGFEALEEGLYLRPNNLVGGIAALRTDLFELGLDGAAVVTRIEEMSESDEKRARALWDGEAVVEGYARLHSQLGDSLGRRDQVSIEEAMREAFLLGREMIRWVALDPLLPSEIVPCAEREAAIDTMIQYDETGKRLWRRYLGIAQTEAAA